jgi:hypothetical protein
MRTSTLIVVAIWIGLGIWLALDGHIQIVIFLIVAAVLSVTVTFSIGGILIGIDKFREKRKNKKSN